MHVNAIPIHIRESLCLDPGLTSKVLDVHELHGDGRQRHTERAGHGIPPDKRRVLNGRLHTRQLRWALPAACVRIARLILGRLIDLQRHVTV